MIRLDDATVLRLRAHVNRIAQEFPTAWDLLGSFRRDKHKLGGWPAWCDVPLSGAYAIAERGSGSGINAASWAARIGALGTWRLTQGIYRFDPTLYEALIDTPIRGALPVDLLYHLPEWAVYIETPGMRWADGNAQYGVFIHLEYDVNTHRSELRAVADTDIGLCTAVLHLTESTLDAAIGSAVDEAERHQLDAFALHPILASLDLTAAAPLLASWWPPVLSLVLYLCSDEPDIDDGSGRLPTLPVARTLNHGREVPVPNAPTGWNVGARIGETIRAALQRRAQGGTHAIPSASKRRAYWHAYLTGQGRTKRKVRWLHPIVVSADEAEPPPDERET